MKKGNKKKVGGKVGKSVFKKKTSLPAAGNPVQTGGGGNPVQHKQIDGMNQGALSLI